MCRLHDAHFIPKCARTVARTISPSSYAVLCLSSFATENLGGLISIGKAGKAVTKQIGKTLTSLGESPDKRGHQRINLANNPQVNAVLGDHKPIAQRLAKGASDLGLGKGTLGVCQYYIWPFDYLCNLILNRIFVFALQAKMKLAVRHIESTLLHSSRAIASRIQLLLTALASGSY
jgi:hypothetical protein